MKFTLNFTDSNNNTLGEIAIIKCYVKANGPVSKTESMALQRCFKNTETDSRSGQVREMINRSQ